MPNFRHHLRRPPADVIFTQDLANPQTRLDNEKGAILETHGLIARDFLKIFEKEWVICSRLARPYFDS